MAATREQTWTIRRLMEWTRPFLERKGLAEPRLATELLLAHALGLRKIDLYTRFEQPVAGEELARFRELVGRAAEHEPIAYLVGYREFFSMRFEVGPDVLIPRPETETLVGEVIHRARQRKQAPAALRILDVGTGAGAIAVALARHLKGATVIATDVSEPALRLAARNAAAHEAAVDFRLGPLFEPVADEGPFDYVCSNPPYIAAADLAGLDRNVRDYEPTGALVAGPTGLEVLAALIEQAPARLADGGCLLLEMAFDQAGRVVPLAERTAGLADVRTLRDSLGHERVLVATKKEGGDDEGRA